MRPRRIVRASRPAAVGGKRTSPLRGRGENATGIFWGQEEEHATHFQVPCIVPGCGKRGAGRTFGERCSPLLRCRPRHHLPYPSCPELADLRLPSSTSSAITGAIFCWGEPEFMCILGGKSVQLTHFFDCTHPSCRARVPGSAGRRVGHSQGWRSRFQRTMPLSREGFSGPVLESTWLLLPHMWRALKVRESLVALSMWRELVSRGMPQPTSTR